MFFDIYRLRSAAAWMRAVATFVLVCFNFVFFISPTAQAVEAEINKDVEHLAAIEQVLESTPNKKLAHRLQKLKDNLILKLPEAIEKREQDKGILDKALAFFTSDLPLVSDEVEELQTLKASIQDAYDAAMAAFEQEAQRIEAHNLPQVAKDRHAQALNKVKAEFDALTADLQILITTEDAEEQQRALDSVTERLLKSQFKRSHTPEDPNRLPWGTPSPEVRDPATTDSDLLSYLQINPFEGKMQFASSGISPAALSMALATFNAPIDADLQATPDAQITPDIQALAEELNHNVVEIYTWVHNNIRFVPSHGSIQGAQMTLETKRGNAMDTASLTIALLRASGIPARYAYGTVEIPSEKVMNWVGGVKSPNAAGNLMGQGGIPNKGFIAGGEVASFQLEHTWVEAYVDFIPSRGMQNGQKDSWISLDPSFKQYDFSEGYDLEQEVPFDAQALVDELEATATINEQEGWVQNVSSTAIEQQLEAYQQQLTEYIENQNPEATVGEVLGLQEIKILEPRPLAAGLPYDHIVTKQQFSEVPDNLRHRFRYELSTSTYGLPSELILSINKSTVELAGKKLALSFSPATEDDLAIIESYLPEPDPDTGEIDPNALPETLPGYLINLTADFTIDGEVVASAPAGTMGNELDEKLGFYDPRFGWDLSSNKPIAGEYQAIGLDLQGASPEYAAKLQAELEATKAKIESGDEAQLATLTKHTLSGNLLESTIFSYFALNSIQDEVAAKQAGIVNYRAPSYGKFTTSLTTSFFFGTPRDVTISGLSMDVDRVANINIDKNNDKQRWLNFGKMVGSRYSSMEHLVPELMFSTEEAPVQGISAVKAIALASAEGQRIWTITQDNLDQALDSLTLSAGTEQEIRSSVSAGKVVTTHEQQLNFNGWIGEGYIILDPETGAGAYKIAGGGNGSFLLGLFLGLALVGMFFAATLATGGLAYTIATIVASVGINGSFLSLMAIDGSDKGFDLQCFVSGLMYGMSLVFYAFGLKVAEGLVYASILSGMGLAGSWSDLPSAKQCVLG